MKKILLLAAAVIIGDAPALAAQNEGSLNRHRVSSAHLERHAERFTLDGVACISKPFLVKGSDGKWAMGASVDCQE